MTTRQTDMPPVKVFIIDDHPIVRGSLRDMCEATPGLAVCGEAGSYGEAIQLLGATNPDIAIVDLGLKVQNGFELLRYLRKHHANVRPVVFSMYEETRYAIRAIKEGAQGYVMKSAPPGAIINAIFDANQGRLVVSEPVQQQILTDVASGQNGPIRPDQVLSGREWQVFECLGKGLTMKETAEQMGISAKTSSSYCERIKAKLNMPRLRDIAQLAHEWLSDNAL